MCLRGQSDRWAEELLAKYRGKVLFVFVYCREAHPQPDGSPPVPLGTATGAVLDDLPALTQTSSREEREARARLFRRSARLSERVLVDEEGERSVQRLFGAPAGANAVVVVDVRGRVVFKGMMTTPAGAEQALGSLRSNHHPARTHPLTRKAIPG